MEFNYNKICLNFFKGLPQRTVEVLERRFGLKKKEKETLQAIGRDYGLTRERVRQIERDGISRIKPKLKDYQKTFEYFNKTLKSSGGLRKEEDLLFALGGKKFQNQVFFLLTLNSDFKRVLESNDYYSLWAVEKKLVDTAKKVVFQTIRDLKKKNKLFTLEELFKNQKKNLTGKINKDIFSSYIAISKEIQKDPEGRFGIKDWLEINPRGIKDKAYLVLKNQGKPLHFTQVASFIKGLPYTSQSKAHTATVHNELIKDPRFVLVGRGLYALKEWGYKPGVVKDIIIDILKEAKKPLSKEDILGKVLEQRFVKENTVSLNLQDREYFLRDPQGRYKINSVKEA